MCDMKHWKIGGVHLFTMGQQFEKLWFIVQLVNVVE